MVCALFTIFQKKAGYRITIKTTHNVRKPTKTWGIVPPYGHPPTHICTCTNAESSSIKWCLMANEYFATCMYCIYKRVGS